MTVTVITPPFTTLTNVREHNPRQIKKALTAQAVTPLKTYS